MVPDTIYTGKIVYDINEVYRNHVCVIKPTSVRKPKKIDVLFYIFTPEYECYCANAKVSDGFWTDQKWVEVKITLLQMGQADLIIQCS